MPTLEIEYSKYSFILPETINKEFYEHIRLLDDKKVNSILRQRSPYKHLRNHCIILVLCISTIFLYPLLKNYEGRVLLVYGIAGYCTYSTLLSLPSLLSDSKERSNYFKQLRHDIEFSKDYMDFLLLQEGNRIVKIDDIEMITDTYNKMGDEELIYNYKNHHSLLPYIVPIVRKEIEKRNLNLSSEKIIANEFIGRSKEEIKSIIKNKLASGEHVDSIRLELIEANVDIIGVLTE